MSLKINRVENSEQLGQIRALFREYAASLEIDLSFQKFEEEVAELPNAYAPPDGCLLLATFDEKPAGCIALRRLDDETCEMKRLYVPPDFRKAGIGKLLAEAVINEARRIGYKRMRLDTLAPMTKAQALYKSLGFAEIAPYYSNPHAGTVFMEKQL